MADIQANPVLRSNIPLLKRREDMKRAIILAGTIGCAALASAQERGARDSQAIPVVSAQAAAPSADTPGTRCRRQAGSASNRAPLIGRFAAWPVQAGTPIVVDLRTSATDPDGDRLSYTYSATSGQVMGGSAVAQWLIFQPGVHSATVQVDDGHGCVATAVTTFTGIAAQQ
jgi:hypothetical protein